MGTFSVTFVVMIQILHKILAFVLALAVLLSTLSFTVEKHVCMGEVTDVSYFSEADSCGMEAVSCENAESGDRVEQSKCCDNLHELIPGDQLEQQALKRLEIQDYDFIVSYISTYLIDLEQGDRADFIEFGPDPPLVERNIQILYQTFLI